MPFLFFLVSLALATWNVHQISGGFNIWKLGPYGFLVVVFQFVFSVLLASLWRETVLESERLDGENSDIKNYICTFLSKEICQIQVDARLKTLAIAQEEAEVQLVRLQTEGLSSRGQLPKVNDSEMSTRFEYANTSLKVKRDDARNAFWNKKVLAEKLSEDFLGATPSHDSHVEYLPEKMRSQRSARIVPDR